MKIMDKLIDRLVDENHDKPVHGYMNK